MKTVQLNNNYIVAGIYKINYPNGKVYIGQSQNIFKRIAEHNSYALHGHGDKKLSPCELAIQKYGIIKEFDILYETTDLSTLDEQETYWIKYFDATNKEKGYNLVAEGNASGKKGIDNCFAAFDKQSLNEVIDLLINHKELSIKAIAEKYNVDQNTIIKISKGKTYTNPNLDYPLRDNNHESVIKQLNDYFPGGEPELLAFKDSLLYDWDLSMEVDIPKKWKIPKDKCKDINYGRLFKEYGNYNYPIRPKNARNNCRFTKEVVKNMLQDLRTTKSSMTDIGKKYGIGRVLVADINKGLKYIIKNYDYPARKTWHEKLD